ncbi:hypothetical protein B0T26DRAFT_406471 [Lasiosphaeria miniovina]|uniref:Uncharacterized protein n=1 Tax=Lasiosphaeria miniovina TaxID=1954250 RepID=A0AA40A5D7_9PEZI|nr:uncharacterized protein B0T26DRAFT_406471 [Lasiosphaeria miniovina]KAK0709453.1 hypothetical protein B0T26DRAFT_406471 [Lasiosphaeria miniovina]
MTFALGRLLVATQSTFPLTPFTLPHPFCSPWRRPARQTGLPRPCSTGVLDADPQHNLHPIQSCICCYLHWPSTSLAFPEKRGGRPGNRLGQTALGPQPILASLSPSDILPQVAHYLQLGRSVGRCFSLGAGLRLQVHRRGFAHASSPVRRQPSARLGNSRSGSQQHAAVRRYFLGSMSILVGQLHLFWAMSNQQAMGPAKLSKLQASTRHFSSKYSAPPP